MTDKPDDSVATLSAYVSLLADHVLRLQRAMLVLAVEETLPVATRVGITQALEGGEGAA